MKNFFGVHRDIIISGLAVIFFVLLFVFSPKYLAGHYKLTGQNQIANATTTPTIPVFIPSYVSTPDPVKGVYMTSWTASKPKLRDIIFDLIKKTELNTVVIDIKDYSGKIVFPINDNPQLSAYGSNDVRDPDLRDFIESLHQKGIYVIGRIAVFQDAYFVKLRPDLAVKTKDGQNVWKDHKGISWIDAGAKPYWDYIILLAKESRKIGFDEINFDYIRYPSDGDMQNISYTWSSTTPKSIMLKNFFSHLHDNLEGTGLKTSADLFGMTTTATSDMGIGQVLENALPYFDYISPMVYPSHYPATFIGFANPEQHPYDVVHFALESAVLRAEKASSTTTKLRPWLQDFGLTMTYGPKEVRDQIKATNDAGLESWLLWSASNVYTESALNKKDSAALNEEN